MDREPIDEAMRPEAVRPEAVRPEAVRPEGAPPDSGRPDAARRALRRVRELFLDDRHLHGCAESAFVALKEAYSLPDPDNASAAMALNGGVAYSGGTCGALTGAALAVGMLAGDRLEDHVAAKRATRLLVAELVREFEAEFGATSCRALSGADLTTEEGHQAFLDRGVWRFTCMRQLELAVERLSPLADETTWRSALVRVEPARQEQGR